MSSVTIPGPTRETEHSESEIAHGMRQAVCSSTFAGTRGFERWKSFESQNKIPVINLVRPAGPK